MDPLSMSASVITICALAAQTVSAFQQTYELCSSIKHTPEDLRLLLEELQLLSMLLSGFEDNASEPTYGAGGGFSTALEHCKHALESIQLFCKDLEDSIFKIKRGMRPWTAFKAMLSEKRVKSYLYRLDRAKSMLFLAHQCCMQSQIMGIIELQRRTLEKTPEHVTIGARNLETKPSIEPCKASEGTALLNESDPDKHTMTNNKAYHRKDVRTYSCSLGVFSVSLVESKSTPGDRRKDFNAKRLNVQPCANRYLHRGFSLLYERSFGAWNYSLRTFNTFSADDAIYRFCVLGDLLGIEQLFSERKASPFDVTRDGFTPLHIAAAFSNAEICRLLLSQGADADAAATSIWSGKDDHGAILIFESGTTPLQVAADCSGRWDCIGGFDLKTRNMLPDNEDFPMFKSNDRSTCFLDTFRVLIENGGDPAASNAKGDTALHMHTGATQHFQYLLQQEQYVADCAQKNCYGDTVAERHARWYWVEGPAKAKLALEHEIDQRRNLCKVDKPLQFPRSSRNLLLHETAGHLRHYFTTDAGNFESALQLIQMLVREDVDIHNVLNEGLPHSKTPLAQITNMDTEIEINQDGVYGENEIMNQVLDRWLKALEEADVNLPQYVGEERRIIQTQGIGRQWELYDLDDSWEHRVEWEFRDRADHQSRPISVHHRFRPVLEEQEKTELIEADKVPGAWVEEFR